MPLVVHFNQGGETLRDNWTPASMLQNNEQRAQSLKIEYPEFADLIDVRTELTELAARNFSNHLASTYVVKAMSFWFAVFADYYLQGTFWVVAIDLVAC